MPLKFNPITGKLDLVGDTTGPVTVQTPNYVQTFNNTTDWGTPSLGYYTIEIPAAIHVKGINPTVQVFELNSGEYENVTVAINVNSSSGRVSIGVLQSPDSRFQGKIIITENN